MKTTFSTTTATDIIAIPQATFSPVPPPTSTNDPSALLCLHQKSTIALEAGLVGGFGGIILISIIWALSLCFLSCYRSKHAKAATEQEQKREIGMRSSEVMNKRERSRTGSYGTESLESGTTERECEVKPRTFRSQEAARQPELKRWPGPVGSAGTRYAEDALEQDDENADDDYASDV